MDWTIAGDLQLSDVTGELGMAGKVQHYDDGSVLVASIVFSSCTSAWIVPASSFNCLSFDITNLPLIGNSIRGDS